MKVLMIELFLPESNYTLELGRELGKKTELTVFCRRGAAAAEKNIRWIDRFYRGGKGKAAAMAGYAKGLFDLYREIRRGHYQVVHVQTFKSAGFEIPLYIRLKPYAGLLVHTVHNLLPHEAKSSDRKLYRRFYRACDLLIVHNEHCKQLLKNDYGISEDKILVIPHGAYTLVSRTEKALRRTEGKTRFLQFGIFRKYKGIDILLEAVSGLPEEWRSRMHFVIAGARHRKLDDTDYEGMIKQLGIEKMVTLRESHIPDEELGDLFGQADICLFPYREIYGSGALLMAYTYGKPVIASDIPVFREETENGETGLLFESENPEALRRALIEAASWTDEEYDRRVSRMNALTMEKYNWKKAAGTLAEAYKREWEKKTQKISSY